jgi:hypothetical protein
MKKKENVSARVLARRNGRVDFNEVIPLAPSFIVDHINNGSKVIIDCSTWLLSPRYGFSGSCSITSSPAVDWTIAMKQTSKGSPLPKSSNSITTTPPTSSLVGVAAARIGVGGDASFVGINAARARRGFTTLPIRTTPLNDRCRSYLMSKDHHTSGTGNGSVVVTYNDRVNALRQERMHNMLRVAHFGENIMAWHCNIELYPPSSPFQGGYIKPHGVHDYDLWLQQHRC